MNYRRELRKMLSEMEIAGISGPVWASRAGVNKSTSHRIVRGKSVPSIETFSALKDAAGKLLTKAKENNRCADATVAAD